ncbi:MAG: hypothetical protein ACR2JC_11770 [Chloroflexota bacterium]
MALPIVVAIIAFAFAASLIRQYWTRPRPHQIVWAFALTLGGTVPIA